jgi:hypothetical protein
VPADDHGNKCTGQTLRKQPCRNKTRHSSGLCWRHRP